MGSGPLECCFNVWAAATGVTCWSAATTWVLLRLMGTVWQLEAGSQSSANLSALANTTATAVQPARDELAEIGDHGDREGND